MHDTRGVSLSTAMDLGVRTWGNSPTGSRHHADGHLPDRWRDQPQAARCPADVDHPRREAWQCPIIPLLADEIVKDEPGQEVVLDRLLDLLLVAALRASFARSGAEVPAWYRASGDPSLVGRCA